jgi:hypothetical protein
VGRVLGDRGTCGWCRGRILATRRDARYCSKRCRQAAHRAKIGRSELRATGRPLRLAYADPPYPGTARRYYGHHPDYAGEVDHVALLSRLATYDGWALSTSARALPAVLSMAVGLGLEVRVAVWHRYPRPHPRARIVNAWDPVVYVPAGPRARPAGTRAVVDSIIGAGVAHSMRRTLPGAVVGMKSPRFCEWLFRLLGGAPGDTLDDLFPGSGIVARSWALYVGQDLRDASLGERRVG